MAWLIPLSSWIWAGKAIFFSHSKDILSLNCVGVLLLRVGSCVKRKFLSSCGVLISAHLEAFENADIGNMYVVGVRTPGAVR